MKTKFVASLVLYALLCSVTRAAPLSTSFNYQGKLLVLDAKGRNVPANSYFDFRFKLFDAPVGGGSVGVTIAVTNLYVYEGVFSLPLDFGAVFNGTATWMELTVRDGQRFCGDCPPPKPNTNVFVVLSPRQALTAVPYALNALNGPPGVQGPAGAKGEPGVQGVPGPAGPKGDTGATGAAGGPGTQGPVGAAGAKGEKGDPGPIGPAGPQGVQGLVGPIGPQGTQGPAGVGANLTAGAGLAINGSVIRISTESAPINSTLVFKGDKLVWETLSVVPGPTGPQGVKGDKGDPGVAGPIGATGPAGPQGTKGDTGLTGSGGPTGATGAQGPQGIKGDTGVAGPQGTPGTTGATGATGPVGPSGPQGPTGLAGAAGNTGPAGATGATGPAGNPGTKGLKWRGAWSVATAYAVDDAVSQSGASWIAKLAHTGSTPVLGSANWELLADKGAAGPQGQQGEKGDTGLTGGTGGSGPQGVPGTAGPVGPTGPQGPIGPIGLTGATGNTGSTGAPGPTGAAGVPGAKGLKWRGVWGVATAYAMDDAVSQNGASWIAKLAHTGSAPAVGNPNWDLLADTGVTGAAGPAGATGLQGIQGSPGPVGPTGLQGPIGLTGATGPQGQQGQPGAIGEVGPQGPQGIQGIPGSADGWRSVGNTGTIQDQNFLGTLDNVPLDFRVKNERALRLEPTLSTPNLIGGYNGNSINSTFVGVTIGGGGKAGFENLVAGSFATIGGGLKNVITGEASTISGGTGNTISGVAATVSGGDSNTANGEQSTIGGGFLNTSGAHFATVGGGSRNISSGRWATIPGGEHNSALGNYSFASGRRAKAKHSGTFVWADDNDEDFVSTRANQFLIRAQNGVEITAGPSSIALSVNGIVSAPSFISGNAGPAVFLSPIRATDIEVIGSLQVDKADRSVGGLNRGLTFGAGASGEGLASNRSGAGMNPFGLDFYSGGLTRMSLLNSGEVQVKGSLQINTDDNNVGGLAPGLTFGNSSGEGLASNRSGTGVNPYGLDFYAGGVNRMSIANGGNIGIHKTAPTTALDVNGTVTAFSDSTEGFEVRGAAGGYALNDRSTGAAGRWSMFSNFGTLGFYTAGATRLYIDSNGKVGIGRTSANNRLEVEGDASKTTAGFWNFNSDRRIKTGIATVTNALQTLDRVRLVSFRYSDEYRAAHPSISDRNYLNVIAQEFREVFPDSVHGSGEKFPDGSEILQVDPYPLTIYAAAAVQELHRKALTQSAEIAALKVKNTALEKANLERRGDLRVRDERIAALERSVAELKALVSGLTQPRGGVR